MSALGQNPSFDPDQANVCFACQPGDILAYDGDEEGRTQLVRVK